MRVIKEGSLSKANLVRFAVSAEEGSPCLITTGGRFRVDPMNGRSRRRRWLIRPEEPESTR